MNNKMKVLSLIKVVLLSLIVNACGDEQSYFPDVVLTPSSARIRFMHAASDASGVNFFLNDTKISSGAAAASAITYASSFPSINYVSVPGGALTLKAIVPATTTLAEKVLVNSTINVDNDKFYSIALAGIAPNYETVLLNDDISSIAFDGKSYVRFVNLIHNSPNKLTVTAKLGNDAPITIAQNIAFKEATSFIAVPPGDYTIDLKDAVTNTVLATASATNKLLTGNRTFTLFARGQIRVTPPVNPYPVTLERATNQ